MDLDPHMSPMEYVSKEKGKTCHLTLKQLIPLNLLCENSRSRLERVANILPRQESITLGEGSL